jgi:hypothetical protein
MADFRPTIEDIYYTKGDTTIIPFQVFEADGTTPHALDGSDTFEFTVDPSQCPPDDTTKLFSVTGVITDAPNGKVTFSPTTLNTDKTKGKYYYDIEAVFITGPVTQTLMKGAFYLSGEITQ